MSNRTQQQRHVHEVIDNLFKEFGTQPVHVGSPSCRPSVSLSYFRPPPPLPDWNVRALTVPPSASID